MVSTWEILISQGLEWEILLQRIALAPIATYLKKKKKKKI